MAVPAYDRDLVLVTPEARSGLRRVVEPNEVEPLALHLLGGAFRPGVGLHGKTNQHLPGPAPAPQALENIHGRFQLNGAGIAALRNLLTRGSLRPPVGDSGAHDQDVAGVEPLIERDRKST